MSELDPNGYRHIGKGCVLRWHKKTQRPCYLLPCPDHVPRKHRQKPPHSRVPNRLQRSNHLPAKPRFRIPLSVHLDHLRYCQLLLRRKSSTLISTTVRHLAPWKVSSPFGGQWIPAAKPSIVGSTQSGPSSFSSASWRALAISPATLSGKA
jgi:hypothetical protein